MKILPFLLLLAGTHAVLASVVFGAAIASPERSGLLPVSLFYADYPCSIFMDWLRNLIHTDTSVRGNLLVDYFVFLVFGSLWFFLIGSLIRQVGHLIGK